MSNDANSGNIFDLANLQRPGTFAHPVTRLDVRETHISRIVLTGAYAYKIKKAVKLGFIDASTLQRRRELCELELRLNYRLAPDLYLDVVAIAQDRSGHLQFGGAGDIVDYAVRMRQFDTTQELHALLMRHEVSVREILELATRLARFHASAAIATDAVDYGNATQVAGIVLSTLHQLVELWGDEQTAPKLNRLIAWIHDQLHRLEQLFELRKRTGAVHECHGDLHARNIVRWQGELVPFDCLEFDPGLRWIDVMSDVAFLVMDLVAHRQPDLACSFLSRYLETGGDYEGVRLLPFYAVYRASVRAMVDAIGVQQMPMQRAEHVLRSRERLDAALQFIDRPAPTLLVMHGASGSGKTWLSEQLINLLPAVRVRSDVERKRMACVDSRHSTEQAVGQGLYHPEFSHRTYVRLLDCAEACLQGGMNTIVDAAFLDVVDRRLFSDLAAHMNVRYLIVSCSAVPAVLAARIAERQRQQRDASDATQVVLASQLRDMQALADHEQPHVVTVDTANATAVQEAIALIQQRVRQPH